MSSFLPIYRNPCIVRNKLPLYITFLLIYQNINISLCRRLDSRNIRKIDIFLNRRNIIGYTGVYNNIGENKDKNINKKNIKMEYKCVVPQTTATDPSYIPINVCPSVSKLSVGVEDKTHFKDFSGDIIIFCVSSQSNDSNKNAESTHKHKILKLSGEVKDFDDQHFDGALQDVINCVEYEAKLGKSVYARLGKNNKIRMGAIVGLGKIEELKASNIPKIGNEIANLIKHHRPTNVALVLHDAMTPREVQTMLESLYIELSGDNRFKSSAEIRNKTITAEKLTLYLKNEEKMKTHVDAARIMADATYFTIQLVNSPANYCNTCSLTNAIVDMAVANGLKVKVLDLPQLEELKMGCYLAVAKGSMYPPKLVHLTYTGEGPIKKKIALIGKGLCFDSGGYNVKSMASHIEAMKIDMGGAGAVFGAAMVIGRLKPKNVEVHFISALAENMISAVAYRPGDIITASNGKTVEIGNTDAEGRLTLADALVYAESLGVHTAIDIATLTGACVVALGEKYAGLFTPDDKLAEEILACGSTTGENIWRLPFVTEYRELLDSKIADLNNIGGAGKGGAITAAVFLKEFVDKMSWAHIDIAGPASTGKEACATGYGVKLLSEFVLKKSLE